MVDKPGATTLAQLAELRRVQARTKQIYSVLIERHESKSINKAGELIQSGAIGKVVQTAALAPHKMTPDTRPPWFFKRAQYWRHPLRSRISQSGRVSLSYVDGSRRGGCVTGGQRAPSPIPGAGRLR